MDELYLAQLLASDPNLEFVSNPIITRLIQLQWKTTYTCIFIEMMVFMLFYFIPLNFYIMSHSYNKYHTKFDLACLCICAIGKLLLFGVEIV